MVQKLTILFDLDGTLIDTAPDLMRAHNYVMKKFGYETKSTEDMRKLVGKGAASLIGRSLWGQAKKEFGRSDIKMSELRKKTFIYKANKKKQFAIIRFRKAIFKLKRFKPVQTAQGVVAHAYNATKLYKGTFLAPVGMGRTKGVFKRDKSSRRRGDIKRVKSGANIGQSYRPALPIKELYGSDFQKTVFKNKTVRKIIANKIKIQFPKELLRALKYRASKVRRR